MSSAKVISHDDLDRIEARLTERGLIKRQMRGRVRQFWLRQVMTVLGAVTLGAMVSPFIGLLAATTALLGELIDVAVLKASLRRLKAKEKLSAVKRVTTLSAVIQALSIAACVLIAKATLPPLTGAFFAYAFLAGAAMNAGIFFFFHPASATARLGVFAGLAFYLMGQDLGQSMTSAQPDYLVVVSALILAGMTYAFVTFSRHTHAKNHKAAYDIIKQNRLLADSISSLRQERENTKKLALVAQHANDSVMMTDDQGVITWVNDGFENTNGYSLEEAIGKRPAELLNSPHTDQKTSDDIVAAIAQGQPHRAEILNRTKDGRDIWMETNSVPIVAEDGSVQTVIAIERDITIAKKHAADLEAARLRAEKGEREKSSFLATISHEIRTPMNAIMGMSELLAAAKLPPEEALYAKTINEASSALLDLLNDSLDLSKIDAGRLELSQSRIDLHETLRGATNMFLATANQKGLTLSCTFAPGMVQFVHADAQRIRQIIVNLVGNALKFTQEGSVTLSATSQDSPTHHLVEILVSDTGIGIPLDRQAEVFDEFSQASEETGKDYGGTGLGLTICRRLAQMMDGDITLTSTPDVGTTFKVALRLRRADQDQAANSTASPGKSLEVDISGMRVMVVDDNATNRLLIKKFLKGQPLSTHFAENGEEAYLSAPQFQPDLILMDYSMPVMNGAEATSEIRQLNAPFHQPYIIALTANDDAETREQCLAAGMNEFMAKPIRKAELLQCLTAHAPTT